MSQTSAPTTRRVVLYELMSIDGFADDPGEGEWLRDTGTGIGDFLAETISTQDAVLLGRRTYDKWAPYWPSSTVQPFADFINGTPEVRVQLLTPGAGMVARIARHRITGLVRCRSQESGRWRHRHSRQPVPRTRTDRRRARG